MMLTSYRDRRGIAMLRPSVLLCSLGMIVLALASFSSRAVAASRTVDFESTPVPPLVAQLQFQYASWNVVFDYPVTPRPFIASGQDYPAPHSGTHVVMGPDSGQEFSDTDLEITFRSAQTEVAVFGGTNCAGATGRLLAFDKQGSIIPVIDSKPLSQDQTSVQFSVAVASPMIWKVSFQAWVSPGSQCSESIDDLSFVGDPPPESQVPPTISLELPQSGRQDYSRSDAIARGRVSGQELSANVELRLFQLDTEGGIPAVASFWAPLSMFSGSDIPYYRVMYGPGAMPIGRYSIEASIWDLSGRRAVDSVEFANLPAGLAEEPGRGAFRFAVTAQYCQMLFYENEALAYFPAGSPVRVPLVIANKWRNVNSPLLGEGRTLGCPIDGPATLARGLVQEFEHGRIYSPTTGPTVYVPDTLTSAFASLSHFLGKAEEVVQIGWPVADPDWFLDAQDPVWIFQRFAQNNRGPAFQNTLEIRGRAPVLYVERVGGDIRERAFAAGEPYDSSTLITESTPSEWLQFPCQRGTTPWPSYCDLSGLDHPPFTLPGALLSVGAACGSVAGSCSTFSGPFSSIQHWVDLNPMLTNHGGPFYAGTIRKFDWDGPYPGSHLAYEDYPFDHESCLGAEESGKDLFGLLVTGGACVISSSACSSTVDWFKGFAGSNCRSDWNLHTRPLPDHRNWGFLAVGNAEDRPGIEDFEIEFEAKWAEHYYTRFHPLPGDNVSVHGRQIVDCGHCDPYKAEIHPADTVVVERAFVSTLYDNVGQVPFRTTAAYIWANGFLPGFFNATIPIPVFVHAPPRPHLLARMVARQHEQGYYRIKNMEAPTHFLPGGLQAVLSKVQYNGEAPDDHGHWLYPTDNPSEFTDYWEISWTQPQ